MKPISGLRSANCETYTPTSHTSIALLGNPATIQVSPLSDRPGIHIKQARSFVIVEAENLPAFIAAIREVDRGQQS